MSKNIGKNVIKHLSGKYSKKRLDHAEEYTRDVFETASKRAIRKKAEATGNFIGSKITDKITKISKTMQQNNSETVTNEHDQEIPNERYISPEERQKIIYDLGLIYYNNVISKNLLHNTLNQPTIFKKRNQVEINDESQGEYEVNQIRFKTLMSRSSLCDYSKACILAEETVTTVNTATATAAANNFNKKVKFKNGGLFIR